MKILDENWSKALGVDIYKGYSSITVFLPFKEAREVAKKLGLKTYKEWKKYCKSGKKPSNVPARSDRTYKNKGWISWGDWLGNNNIDPYAKKFLPFREAREFTIALKLKPKKKGDRREWRKYIKCEKSPDNLPYNPPTFYRNKGWVSWKDWLGY